MEINSFLVMGKPMQVSYQEVGTKATKKAKIKAFLATCTQFLDLAP
jgi:hypothetical protein